MKCRSIYGLIAFAALVTAASLSPAGAAPMETYASLVKQGFQTSRLTTHPVTREAGWFVTKRHPGYTSKFFCRPADVYYQGGKTGVGQLKRAQPVAMTVQAYEALAKTAHKPAIAELPKLGDLLSGHPRPDKDIAGACEANMTEFRSY